MSLSRCKKGKYAIKLLLSVIQTKGKPALKFLCEKLVLNVAGLFSHSSSWPFILSFGEFTFGVAIQCFVCTVNWMNLMWSNLFVSCQSGNLSDMYRQPTSGNSTRADSDNEDMDIRKLLKDIEYLGMNMVFCCLCLIIFGNICPLA